MTKKEKKELLAEATANFKIEGISVTPRMVEDGTKMLNGEITKDELIRKYVKEFKQIDDQVWTWKTYFGDFLHVFFDYESETIGNFYAYFIDDDSVTLVDENGIKCVDPSIYQLLKSYELRYGFLICDDFVMRNIDSLKVTMKSLFEDYEGDYKPSLVDFGDPVGREIL